MAFSDYINSPATTYTLEQFIAMKNTDDITYRNFSILEIVDDIELLDHNLIDEYLSEFDQLAVPIELSTDEFRRYKYCPDLLAFDIYGSVQLDFVILAINDMIDPKEFCLKKIKLLTASNLKSILSSIYNANNNYIQKNRYNNNIKD